MSSSPLHSIEYIHSFPNVQPDRVFSPAEFSPVKLLGPDYMPGSRIFPRHVVGAYEADIAAYNADSWAAHVLKQTGEYSLGTSCWSCSLLDPNSSGPRNWVGYAFSGGPVNADDFIKGRAVMQLADARAFSIVIRDKE